MQNLMTKKIFNSREELKKEIAARQAKGARVVLTNGVFDLIHVGHVRYLREAKAQGDVLLVALNTDASVRKLNKGPERPINSELARAEVMAALESVDYVTLFSEDTAEQVVRDLRPDVYVKGGDYKIEDTPEGKAVLSYGGKAKALQFVPGFSTTEILKKSKI